MKSASVIHSSEISVIHLNMHSCPLASFQLEKNVVKHGIFFLYKVKELFALSIT